MEAHYLVIYALNALWITPLLSGLGYILRKLLRGRPAAEHWLWIVIIVSIAVLPSMKINGHYRVLRPYEREVTTQSSYTQPEWSESLVLPVATRVNLKPFCEQMIGVGYVLLVLLGCVRLAREVLAIQRAIRASSTARLSAENLALLQQCCISLRVRCPIILESHSYSGPAVFGSFMPRLILPNGFFEDQTIDIEGVLKHELSHIKRHDGILAILIEVVLLPMWFHPALRIARVRLHMSRELACDARVLQQRVRPLAYAQTLLAFARKQSAQKRFQVETLSLTDVDSLEERIMNIITPARYRGTAFILSLLNAALAAAVIGPLLLFGGVTVNLASAQSSKLIIPRQNAPQMQQALTATWPTMMLPQNDIAGKSGEQSKKQPGQSQRGNILRQGGKDLSPKEREKVEKELGMTTEELQRTVANLKTPETQKKLFGALKLANDPTTTTALNKATVFAKSSTLPKMLHSLREDGYIK